MNADYAEEDDIGKPNIEQYFSRMRLTTKQPSHRFLVNNNEVRQPPDLDKQNQREEKHIATTDPDANQPPPGLDMPVHTYHM
eukprot:4645335-Amphidinium_carterae.1